MSAIDRLLGRLDGVRQAKANSWMTRCPAHNGEGRSLAVTHGDDGRILIHCFAHECDVMDILAAVGMTVGDLFPERLTHNHLQPRKHAISAADVMTAMRIECWCLQFMAEQMGRGEVTPELMERAQLSAQRVRTALNLCDG